MRIVYFIILFTFVCNYAKNQGLTNSLDNISHENLLDNPWFTVNQRGQSSYTDPGNGKYTVDRWKIYNYNTLTVSSNGVSSIGLFQYFEEDRVKPLLGKTVTLSILFQDGRIRYSSGQLPNAFPSVDTVYIKTNIGDNTWIYITLTSSKLLQVQIRNWSNQVIDVRAVKLEFGSISTLSMDTAPNYATELLKCQRYFISFNPLFSDLGNGGAVGVKFDNIGAIAFTVPIPVAMRAKPELSVTNYGFIVYVDGTTFIPSSIAIDDVFNNALRMYVPIAQTAGNKMAVWQDYIFTASAEL